jgi:hypothetical protein
MGVRIQDVFADDGEACDLHNDVLVDEFDFFFKKKSRFSLNDRHEGFHKNGIPPFQTSILRLDRVIELTR